MKISKRKEVTVREDKRKEVKIIENKGKKRKEGKISEK